MPDLPTKLCAVCGRTIEWRKKWERSWDGVKYCSNACRSRGLTETDRQLEEAILSLLAQRKAGATICPSEAARAVAATTDARERTHEDAWRSLMEPARMAARRLVADETVVITQKGRVVDPSTATGAIRVRLASG